MTSNSFPCDLCGSEGHDRVMQRGDEWLVRCRTCGFIYVLPCRTDTLQDNDDYYQTKLQECIKGNYSQSSQRSYRNILKKLSPFRKTNTLLDIGSNVGGILCQAREQGWQPMGVEPLDAYARYAREEKGLTTLSAPFEKAELPANHFDAVVCKSVIEHVLSPTELLKTAFHVLRPGGACYVNTLNYDSYTCELWGAKWRLVAFPGHLSFFTPSTLKQFFVKAGFEVLKCSARGVKIPKDNGNALLRSVRKGVMGVLSRFTFKGDRLIVLARKPQ